MADHQTTRPDGTVVTFDGTGRVIEQTPPDGRTTTTFEYREHGEYVATTGDQHARYDGDGRLTETWNGDDRSVADHYTYPGNGDLVITAGDGSTTGYGPDGMQTVTTGTDGSVIHWKADLGKLADAARITQTNATAVALLLMRLRAAFDGITAAWESPASKSFLMVADDFDKAAGDMANVLAEAARRMRVAHENYVAAEEQNAKDITAISRAGHQHADGIHHSGDAGGGGGGSGDHGGGRGGTTTTASMRRGFSA